MEGFDSDFITKLAAMQANAKFKGGGGGRGPAVMGGGSFEHPGSIRGNVNESLKQSNTQIDAGGIIGAGAMIAHLFGWKTPQEKQALYERLQKSLDEMPDDVREKFVRNADTQKILKGMSDAGGYRVQKENDGYYRFEPRSQEAKLQGMSPGQILAAGGQPAENLIKGMKAERGLTATDIEAGLGPEGSREKLVQTHKELAEASETPQMKQFRELQMEVERQKAALLVKQVGEEDEEFKLRMAQAKQQSELWSSQAKHANAQADLALAQAKDIQEGYSKNPALQQANQLFLHNQATIFDKYAAMPGGNTEANVFNMNKELAGMAQSHIALVKTEAKNDRMSQELSNVSLLPWFNRVDLEFDRPQAKASGLLGGNTTEIENQKIRRLAYIRMGTDLLQQSGNKSPAMLGNIVSWCMVAGGDDPKNQNKLIAQSLGRLGLSDNEIGVAIDTASQMYRKKKNILQEAVPVAPQQSLQGQMPEGSPLNIQ